MVVCREIAVFSKQHNFWTQEHLRAPEKLMPKGSSGAKIVIVSPRDVWVKEHAGGPAYADPDVRTNPLAWVAENQVERRRKQKQIRAAMPVILSVGEVGKGESPTVRVGINFEAHDPMQRGRKESHFQPGTKAFLDRARNRRSLIEHILITRPAPQGIEA